MQTDFAQWRTCTKGPQHPEKPTHGKRPPRCLRSLPRGRRPTTVLHSSLRDRVVGDLIVIGDEHRSTVAQFTQHSSEFQLAVSSLEAA